MSSQQNNNNNSSSSSSSDSNLLDERSGFKSRAASLIGELEEKISELDVKQQHWDALQKKMEERRAAANDKIVLDIGGKRFATTKRTLLSAPGSFFDGLLSLSESSDDDGTYFIDRDPELFPLVMRFLRTGKCDTKRYQQHDVLDVQQEFDFYGINVPQFPVTKLLTADHQKQIREWIGNAKTFTFPVLYVATRDGFAASKFHQLCDNKGPTVVVVKSGQNIFGGYAALSWNSAGAYISANQSFLFTLINPHGTTAKFSNTNISNSLYCGQTYGPTFGGGHDLYIADNANSNQSSYSGLPNSYADHLGRGNTTFTGSKNFSVDEIEVFAAN